MYRIVKKFHFSASHILDSLPPDHPCARLHGHNYTVEIELESEKLNSNGFVVDYSDLNLFKKIIDSELDHRHLNDVIQGQPTAEIIAYYLFQRARKLWPEVSAVRVKETEKTMAEYRPFGLDYDRTQYKVQI